MSAVILDLPRVVLELAVRPVLAAMGLPGGAAAERLLIGTAAQESEFRRVRQMGGGPAVSLWQMEPDTVRDALARFSRPDLLTCFAMPRVGALEQLPYNPLFGAAVARAVYYLKPFKLRGDESLPELAAIYKLYWNSPLGAATEGEFLKNWALYCARLYKA